MIDRATVERIMNAADIVDVISDFVSLRKRGTSYKGLCPFHDDTTPSFSVSPSRGVYKCFACGKAGNVVNFIMEHEQMTYVDALKWLAKKYHIEVEERELTDDERRAESERESTLIVSQWAAEYFVNTLHNHPDGIAVGMQYFRTRGFRDDIISKFQLGFALNKRDAMATAALAAGYKEEYLIAAGLCGKNERGSLYDRFAGRVIFPWHSVGGKVIAFGGRLLDARTKGVSQKYVNSPDSIIYHKDHELYGLFQAKRAITKEDKVYMVEGYTDVIAMHQCGIENVVANSGTALSIHQIRLLKRFTQNIVLLYDGDEAGIHAAMRGTDMLLAEGLNVKVLLLPDQEDPDSFARKHTAQQMRDYIEEHQTDFIEFKIATMLKGVNDPIKRAEAVNSIVQSISVIRDSVVRATYTRICADKVQMAEQTIITQMNKMIRKRQDEEQRNIQRQNDQASAQRQDAQNETGETSTPPSPSALVRRDTLYRDERNMSYLDMVERDLVQLVMRHGEEVIFPGMETDDGKTVDINLAQYVYLDLQEDHIALKNPLYQQILEEAVNHSTEEGFEASRYFVTHPEQQVSALAVQLTTERYQLSKSLQLKYEPDNWREHARHLVLDYRRYYVEEKLKLYRQRLKEASDKGDDVMAILKEISEMQALSNKMFHMRGSEIKHLPHA